jgi:transaldolase/glucose-6-phosphate isomerase
MSHNPATAVQAFGQSIWLDYIHRKELDSGEFQRRLDEDGVLGVTSNPSIFQQAIGESDTYDERIAHLLDQEANVVYEALAIADIQAAADLLRPIYERSAKRDGYVSLEVSPLLAHDSDSTLAEAKRLFAAVGRPNLMIKIPATQEGLPAIADAIAAGININVTLIFSVANYRQVADAFIKGLERRLANGESVQDIASVASFFLSRIDTAVDRILENNIRSAQVHGDTGRIAANRRLLGQAAVANAKLAYRAFKEMFYGPRFAKLREAGAQVQRPLWASTGNKNPSYSDTRYVDMLIGKDTVNTVPPKTLAAFNDHGMVAETLERDLEDFMNPDEVMDKLAEVGVDMKQVTDSLQHDGVEAFEDAFEKLMGQIAAKLTILRTGVAARQNLAMGLYVDAYNAALADLDKKFVNGRLWGKDGTIWKESGPIIAKIKNRLGWLDVRQTMDIARLKALQASIKGSSFEHILLMGMGGSSLAPEVMYHTFGRQEGFPAFLMLDSTDPDQIARLEAQIDPARTLYIVASKSGTTVETDSFYRYFWDKSGGQASQFIAITDPDTALAQEATQRGFREVFLNPADIGGRYSALSYFGLVPAALMGLDLDRLWTSATSMMEACGESIPSAFHPGLTLGAFIGTLAQRGRDKLTITCSQSLASFGNWIEQLVAESSGKEGRGVLPIVGATVGKPHDFASDRLFVYLRVDNDADVEELDAAVRTLREAGHPRVTLRLPDAYALGGEFFRWAYATAIIGAILQVNPFDEPNVTEAKEATKAALAVYQETGHLPSSAPVLSAEGVELYADEPTLAPLRELCRAHGYDAESLVEVLAAQVAGTHAGDYFAILAYLTPTPELEESLRDIQRRLRHVSKRATTIGYGPRYLHSTGQLHKGGADNGVFIQLTSQPQAQRAIPGAPYDFGTLFQAQAVGDLQALQAHKRRALRLHSPQPQALLALLNAALDFAEARRQ